MPDPRFNCIRPDCHYDLKSFDYYRNPNNPEEFFILEGVTYDYFEDYEKWNHVEQYPFYPLDNGPGIEHPQGASLLTKVISYNPYGFRYSSFTFPFSSKTILTSASQ